ncbi:hypothetical protein OMAG_002666 [Candidatus Omnitrophus magneticus]|uniref:WD40 repeat-like protein n=1 Tax=Candidatus Omnitrophus magneticus TaxID=1609969 RepID=A0A0F0CJQ3_9BACT|nr:hypothetical protein OMAG_002666 [Candidatus Omnitrophus magneticus]
MSPKNNFYTDRIIVAGSQDCIVRLYKLGEDKPFQEIDENYNFIDIGNGKIEKQHTNYDEVSKLIKMVDFSFDGLELLIATKEYDKGKVTLWEYNSTSQKFSNTPKQSFFNEDNPIVSAKFSPDKNYIALGSIGGKVRIYNRNSDGFYEFSQILHQGTLDIYKFRERDLNFHEIFPKLLEQGYVDEDTRTVETHNILEDDFVDQFTSYTEKEKKKLERLFEEFTKTPYVIKFSPDSKTIYVGAENRVFIYEFDEYYQKFPDDPNTTIPLQYGPVTCIDFLPKKSPYGETLLVSSPGGLHFFTHDGTFKNIHLQQMLNGESGMFEDMAVSNDGKIIFGVSSGGHLERYVYFKNYGYTLDNIFIHKTITYETAHAFENTCKILKSGGDIMFQTPSKKGSTTLYEYKNCPKETPLTDQLPNLDFTFPETTFEYHSEFFIKNLARLLTLNPNKTFLIAIDTDIGKTLNQESILMPFWKIASNLKQILEKETGTTINNLKIIRTSASDNNLSQKIEETLTDDNSIKKEDILMLADDSNINYFKDFLKQSWIMFMQDKGLKDNTYLPIFESLSLLIMAYSGADKNSFKYYYDKISAKPINSGDLDDFDDTDDFLLYKKPFFLTPKITTYSREELRKKYELAYKFYTAA